MALLRYHLNKNLNLWFPKEIIGVVKEYIDTTVVYLIQHLQIIRWVPQTDSRTVRLFRKYLPHAYDDHEFIKIGARISWLYDQNYLFLRQYIMNNFERQDFDLRNLFPLVFTNNHPQSSGPRFYFFKYRYFIIGVGYRKDCNYNILDVCYIDTRTMTPQYFPILSLNDKVYLAQNLCTAQYHNLLYFVGGEKGPPDLYNYITIKQPSSGLNYDPTANNLVYCFNAKNFKWSQLISMNYACRPFSCIIFNDYLYVISYTNFYNKDLWLLKREYTFERLKLGLTDYLVLKSNEGEKQWQILPVPINIYYQRPKLINYDDDNILLYEYNSLSCTACELYNVSKQQWCLFNDKKKTNN